jgi:hypothetical protein
MAETTLATASRVQKWNADFFTEYVRDNAFFPYMGTVSKNVLSPIVVDRTLVSAGQTVNLPLVTRLKGNGVQGNAQLTSNEEALGNFNMPISVEWNRNGVLVTKREEHWTEIDLRDAAKMVLKTWAAERLRDDIIIAAMAVDGSSRIAGKLTSTPDAAALTPLAAYTAQVEATKDAWMVANSDRYLFGKLVANAVSGVHATALLTLDTTDDRLTAAMVTLAKLRAKAADPHIRPFKSNSSLGREWFVLFVSSLGMRDLKADATIAAANREARPRDVSENPIFQDGDLIYDGVIIREVPEIPVVVGVGNGGSDVAPAFLCGAQAVGLAWGQDVQSKTQSTDYEFRKGVAVEEMRGVAKMVYNGKQHGMLTIWHSAPASA